ncbi:MAG: peptidase S8/S53 subtilisin kexin sedolisin [Tepidisphaerales bacterium]
MARKHSGYRSQFEFQPLEARQLLSAGPTGLSPQQVAHAYGFDKITLGASGQTIKADGSGQTIAIVDAYDSATIANDLKVFDKTFNLSDTNSAGQFVLTKVKMKANVRADAGWAQEIALDVEWAHAMAPKASILLVEAASENIPDLMAAVDYARKQAGVVAVSMSWGGSEFRGETSYDSTFTTPSGHVGGSGIAGGVAFVTASGDSGAGAEWPAVSPNVIGVGGTTLKLDSTGNYLGETAWNLSGGGYSLYETKQASSPDVAFAANPNNGVSVYDSTPASGVVGWQTVGGTSVGAPTWAGLLALVDQSRALNKLGSLDSGTALAAIYAASSSDFHDIVSGNNGYYSAGPGYDLVTGRGSPVANLLVPDLAAYTASATGRPASVGGSTGGTGVTSNPGQGYGGYGGYGYGHRRHGWW